MDKNMQDQNCVKQSWTKPELVELQEGCGSIEAGFAPGTDGDGGISTSQS
ncbi:hypothetical protein ACR9YC_10055 [Parasphingorhabdus sp. DH2-15]